MTVYQMVYTNQWILTELYTCTIHLFNYEEIKLNNKIKFKKVNIKYSRMF